MAGGRRYSHRGIITEAGLFLPALLLLDLSKIPGWGRKGRTLVLAFESRSNASAQPKLLK